MLTFHITLFYITYTHTLHIHACPPMIPYAEEVVDLVSKKYPEGESGGRRKNKG